MICQRFASKNLNLFSFDKPLKPDVVNLFVKIVLPMSTQDPEKIFQEKIDNEIKIEPKDEVVDWIRSLGTDRRP